MNDELIDDAGLAQLIKDVSPEQVAIWRRARNWPCVKFGRQVRYTPEHVQAILRMQEHRPSSKADKTSKPAPVVIEGQTARSARRSA